LPLDAGPHSLAWDGRDDEGRALPAGLLFARLSTNGIERSRRIVVTR